MNDLISKSALINYIKAWDIGNGIMHNQSTFIDAVNAQEVVDAVEVVRCKDCEHFVRFENTSYGYCKVWSIGYEENECREAGFCSYGERK